MERKWYLQHACISTHGQQTCRPELMKRMKTESGAYVKCFPTLNSLLFTDSSGESYLKINIRWLRVTFLPVFDPILKFQIYPVCLD